MVDYGHTFSRKCKEYTYTHIYVQLALKKRSIEFSIEIYMYIFKQYFISYTYKYIRWHLANFSNKINKKKNIFEELQIEQTTGISHINCHYQQKVVMQL